jgi:hypothetical protein
LDKVKLSLLENRTAEPYNASVHTVVETPEYLSDARAARLTEHEQSAIVEFIASHPNAGDIIPNTGGARKVRFAGRGKGKSGGYRVVTFYTGPDLPVFLLNVFAKGDKINLTRAERNELRVILADIAAAYKQGARRHEQSR